MWLRLCAYTAGGMGSTPGWGTNILHAVCSAAKNIKLKKKIKHIILEKAIIIINVLDTAKHFPSEFTEPLHTGPWEWQPYHLILQTGKPTATSCPPTGTVPNTATLPKPGPRPSPSPEGFLLAFRSKVPWDGRVLPSLSPCSIIHTGELARNELVQSVTCHIFFWRGQFGSSVAV